MITEPVVGIEIRITVELVARAVETLTATLGVDQNHDARAAAVLGIKVSGEGFKFAHGVDAEVGIFTVVGAHIGVDDAVEEEVIRSTAHSVHKEIVGLVEDQAELGGVVGDDAG